MRTALLTVGLLVVVCCMALRRPQSDRDRELAEELLGSVEIQRLQLSDANGPPAYQAGSRAALFFRRKGLQGLIRGVVVVEGDRVLDLRVLESHEGLDRDPFDSPGFAASFRGQPARPPLVADAVSGATISAQAVTDAVNARLAEWVTHTQREMDIHSQP